uniref:Cytochrome P450 n=1 Tax=Macrostomum lignano TaxID=282301 RepID=A0A1I8GER8_9PLAT
MLEFLIPLTLACLAAYWYFTWNRCLPPGPTGLPLVGVAPWLAVKRRDHYFTELAKQYGDIFTVRVGFFYIVVLNSAEAIKEAFARNEHIAGRGLRAFTKFLSDGKGIASAEGVRHREQRRYCLRVLRDFGFGRINFEGAIIEEAGRLADSIRANGSARQFASTAAIANVIGRIVYGRRFEYNSAELRRMVSALHELNSAPGGVLLLNTTSLLDPLADWLGVGKLKAARDGIRDLLEPIVAEHQADLDELDEDGLTDFLYAYLAEQKRHRSLPDADIWDDRQMMEVLIDLMVAGSDTTRSTLVWAINLLSGSQPVQEAVRQELASAVGDARPPSTSDLPRLPRLDAVIQEVLRISALVPTAVPHCCTSDTELRGYQLPLGTMVMANTHCLTRDADVFANPDQFDPFGHFLTVGDEGSGQLQVVNKDKILPFSYGRRSCIGESLARMEICLFLSYLLPRFRFELPPGVTDADTTIMSAPRPRTQLKSRLLKLFTHSTVHGISHAASSNSRFERLFWLVLVFSGVAMFSANLVQVVHRYCRFPILTAYYASQEPFSWPCITFCDNTPVLLDDNTTNDEYQTAVGNLTADPEIQSLAPLMDSFFENSLREESLNVLVRAIVLSTMDGVALGAENPKSIVPTVGYKVQTEQIQTEINMDSNWNLLQDVDTMRFFHSSSVVMRYRCACHTLQLGDFVRRGNYRSIDSLQFFLRGNYLTYLRFNSSNYQFGGRLFIHQPGSLPEDGRQIETPPGVTTTAYLVQKRYRLLQRNNNCRNTEKTASVFDYRMQTARQYNLSYSYCHQVVSQQLFYQHCRCFNPHLIVPKLDSLPPVLCFNLSVYSKAEVARNLQCLNQTAAFYRNESNFSPWLRRECGDLKRQRCDSIVWEMEKQRELYREMWTETANPARVSFIRDSIK